MKKVKLTLLENTASQSVWFQPAIQSLNLRRLAVKSNFFLKSVARGRKTSKDSKQFTVTSSPPRIPTYHRSPNAVTVSPNVNSVRHAKPEPKPAQCKLDQSKKSSPETSSKQRQAPREACECGGGFLAWARTEPTKTCCSEEKNESRKQRLDDFIL